MRRLLVQGIGEVEAICHPRHACSGLAGFCREAGMGQAVVDTCSTFSRGA